MSELKDYFRKYFEKTIKNYEKTDEGKKLMSRFYKYYNDKEVNYDISGFSMIFMIPPDLSGYNTVYPGVKGKIDSVCKKTLYLSLDISAPESQITASELASGSSSKIPYAQFRTTGGNFNISYFDVRDLDLYWLHSQWSNYIVDTISGDVCPDDKYITGDEAGAIDYATSMYFIKLKPFTTDISYIGKATGVFPLNLPNKDILGSRQNNQLSIFPINYICGDYNELLLVHKEEDRNSWIEDEFVSDIGTYLER
jgi:hypothetical protein